MLGYMPAAQPEVIPALPGMIFRYGALVHSTDARFD